MEENNSNQAIDHNSNDVILTISRNGANYLLEISKWTHFLSILGFIFTGLIVLLGLFAGSFLAAIMQDQASNMPAGFSYIMSFIYVLMGLLYFFPSLYLFKYSRKLKAALSKRDNQELVAALENEKSLYKFWGIFTIIMLGLYALMLLFTLGLSSLLR